jgi:hypothetical protein
MRLTSTSVPVDPRYSKVAGSVRLFEAARVIHEADPPPSSRGSPSQIEPGVGKDWGSRAITANIMAGAYRIRGF